MNRIGKTTVLVVLVMVLAATASIAFAAAPIPADPGNPGDPSGDGIQPVEYLDNPTCSDFGNWYELKVEPVADGEYSDGYLTVTIDEYSTADGQVFDWSSNVGVDAVFVKGGNNGNFYDYDPQDDGTEDDGDTMLHASVNTDGSGTYYGLSHISFCYDIELDVSKTAEGTYDRTHTWDIEKSVSPTSQSGFAGDFLDWTWTVDLSESYKDSNFAVEGTITIYNPAPDPVDFDVADELDDGTTTSVTCPSYTVPAGSSIECSYTASPNDASAMLNTATVTSLTPGVNGDTATSAVGWTATVYNGTADVDDDQESDFPTTVNAGAGPWQWTETQDHTCSTNPDDYGEDGSYSATLDNYATVTGSDGQTDNAEAHTTYTCYIWDVSKTADGTYDDQYKWDITKTVDPESQSGFAGDTLEWEWTITWSSSFDKEVNHAVEGVITVDNPADIELTVDVADELSGGLAATVTCNDGDGGTDLTVAANSSGTCNYTAAPDSQVAQNTATTTRNGFSVSDTVNVNWTKGEDLGLDATISDSNHADIPVDSAQPFQYIESVDCSTDTSLYVDDDVSYSGDADNEATITWNDGSDSSTADTDYTCYIPEISKTAEGTYDETHTWDIEKYVDPTSQTGYPGDELSWEWKVTLSETFVDSNFRVNGVITLVNPNPEDELEVTLTDTLNGSPPSTIGLYPNAATNCNLSAGAVWTLPAGATGTCNYISTVTWDDWADVPTQNDVRAHLYFGDPDRHSAVKYVATPISWTANVINGTADVDDNQESDFPTTVNAGDGPWEWTETQSHTCSELRSDYGADGSYSDTRYNTATVEGSDGQTDSSSANTTYTCETSYVDVLKLTNGVPNPDMSWSFELRQEGSTIESLSTPPTLLEFQTTLVPGDEYAMCETGIPPSWTIQWALDSNGNGVIDEGETLPFVGGEADLVGDGLLQVYDPDPAYGTDGAVNDTRCVNFLADSDAGDTVHFIVDNQRPGGEPRTPGYWKNWNTCTGGNQPQTAANNGGPSEGWFLLDDLIPTTVGDLEIASCEDGVNILDQRDLGGNNRKRASDAAYTLAMHLLAAKLNLAAGAETCPAVVDAVAAGDALLSDIGFDGTGQFLRPKDAEYQDALDLAGTLDAYNNGELCSP